MQPLAQAGHEVTGTHIAVTLPLGQLPEVTWPFAPSPEKKAAGGKLGSEVQRTAYQERLASATPHQQPKVKS